MTKASALSDLTIKKATPREKGYRLTDGEGLSILVQPSGKKLWQLRVNGTTLSLGAYPGLSLKDARTKRDDVKEDLRKGVNAVSKERQGQAALKQSATSDRLTVRQLWEHYDRRVTNRLSKKQRDINLQRLERHVFPEIGDRPADGITGPQALELIRKVIDKGSPITGRPIYQTAEKVRSSLARAFSLAEVEGKVSRNPWEAVKRATIIEKPKSNSRAAVPVQRFPELAWDIWNYRGEPITRYAMRFTMLTWMRSHAVRQARWTDFDMDAKIWRIPGQFMEEEKQQAGGMKMRLEHWVPLSLQVLEILKVMRETYSHPESPWVFHLVHRHKSPMAEGRMLETLYDLGHKGKYKGIQTVHGFRALARTLTSEKTQFSKDAAELCLAHVKGGVEGVYDRAERLEERTKLLQWWADYVDEARASHEAKIGATMAGGFAAMPALHSATSRPSPATV